ncbi:unnamed protein product [Arabis nemorensis]|uniref:DUF1985 domain-containing protein n=1 Tax=Arabis nemorensis TaxID=586526 RepID=A0A565C2D1_9BRAS|nr:unnamed protein product [Arabis nemorensis]
MERSLHHNCKLGDFDKMLEAVGEEVFNDIMNNHGVGVILKLALSKMIWTAKPIQHILGNQLTIDTMNEIWVLVGGRPMRFSLHEFAEITTLKCDPFYDKDILDVDHTYLWKDMKVDVGLAPSWDELIAVFDFYRTWSYEKRKMVALLFVLHVGIYEFARSSRIPLMAAKRVFESRSI